MLGSVRNIDKTAVLLYIDKWKETVKGKLPCCAHTIQDANLDIFTSNKKMLSVTTRNRLKHGMTHYTLMRKRGWDIWNSPVDKQLLLLDIRKTSSVEVGYIIHLYKWLVVTENKQIKQEEENKD